MVVDACPYLHAVQRKVCPGTSKVSLMGTGQLLSPDPIAGPASTCTSGWVNATLLYMGVLFYLCSGWLLGWAV